MGKPRDLCTNCRKWQTCQRVTELKNALDNCGEVVLNDLERWDANDHWVKKARDKKFNETKTRAAIITCDEYERVP